LKRRYQAGTYYFAVYLDDGNPGNACEGDPGDVVGSSRDSGLGLTCS
jgi:hypothetical protein